MHHRTMPRRNDTIDLNREGAKSAKGNAKKHKGTDY
jgi:hypothetical protein